MLLPPRQIQGHDGVGPLSLLGHPGPCSAMSEDNGLHSMHQRPHFWMLHKGTYQTSWAQLHQQPTLQSGIPHAFISIPSQVLWTSSRHWQVPHEGGWICPGLGPVEA